MSDSNNFRELKTLLRFKQHEAAPPGYFNHFSGEVMSRIRSGERGGSVSLADRLGSGSFAAGFLQLFQARPGIIGGFATSLCVLLLVGIVMADRPEDTNLTGAASTALTAPSVAGTPLASTVPAMGNGGTEPAVLAGAGNSDHALQAMPALFGSQQNPLFQPVSFMQSGQ